MRTKLFLLAAGVLTISLVSAPAQIYDFTTIAGAVTNSGSADGTNSNAQFYSPVGVAVDGSGNLYVGDWGNSIIRKIAPVGTNWVTTTIAGSAGNYGSADGTNSDAQFYFPAGIAVDGSGSLYVADTYNNTIRKVTPVGTNWVTTTIAGLALNDGSTDGTNSTARFSSPVGIAVDGDGNIYVADMSNNTIRKVSPVGMNWVVSTIGGLAGNAGSADGLNNHARFSSPFGVAVDANGSLYVTDEGNDTIRQGVPWGTLTITKETAMLNFVKTNSDSCTLTGTLTLEPGFSVTNKAVTVDIGGAQALFTLDAKGSGTSPPNTCKLSYNKKTVLWTFTAKLKSGSWATPWAAYGLSNSTVTASSVTLPATLVIGDEGFYGEKNLLYKAKAGKSGSAK
jgi:sugar lactone lactonase YvrE